MRARLFVLGLLLWPGTAGAAAWTLDELLARMAAMTQSQARFEQEIYVSYLKQPMHLSGRVAYSAPGRMVMQFEEPRWQRLTFENGEVHVEEAAGAEALTVATGADPVLRAVALSLQALFEGEGAALRQAFEVSFTGGADDWHLSLTPKDADVAAVVAAIEMRGRDNLVLHYALRRRDGDHMVMTFTPLP